MGNTQGRVLLFRQAVSLLPLPAPPTHPYPCAISTLVLSPYPCTISKSHYKRSKEVFVTPLLPPITRIYYADRAFFRFTWVLSASIRVRHLFAVVTLIVKAPAISCSVAFGCSARYACTRSRLFTSSFASVAASSGGMVSACSSFGEGNAS